MKHPVRGRDDRRLPTDVGKRCWQFAHDIANPTDLAAGQRTILSCYDYDVFLADDGKPDLTREMQVLTEHVGRDKCQSRFGYTKSTLAVIVLVFADNGTVRDYCTSIDDRTIDAAVLTDIHIG
jgi:hypothetical protein